jgi:hypothetical protein
MLVPDKRLAVGASQQLEQSERENVGRRKSPASFLAVDEIMVAQDDWRAFGLGALRLGSGHCYGE